MRDCLRSLMVVLVALASGLLPVAPDAGTATAVTREHRGAADDARSLYLLPITDGQPTTDRVRSIVRHLGRGGPYLKVGFSGVFRYLADVDPGRDYQIDTTRLEEIAAAAREARAPFLVHLNGGRWAGGGPLVAKLAQDRNALAWDQEGHPWTHLVDGEYHFSLSSYNEEYRRYKERNLRAAAAWLGAFADGPDGHLLVGVSTDSEVILHLQPYYDYSPGAIAEFVDWLASRNGYGSGGRWEGEGQGLTLQALNERYGTRFSRLEQVEPPRGDDGSRFWQDWTTFRVLLVDHSVQEQVDWIREAGLPPERIFSHQSPALDPVVYGDSLATAQVDGGNLGITLYGGWTLDADRLHAARALSPTWGVLEYNVQNADFATNLAALDLLRSFSPRVVCPYHWDDLGGPNEVGHTILGSPLDQALRAFVRRYRAEPLPAG